MAVRRKGRVGKAAVHTTGLLSQEAGLSEDGEATFNSDTPQLRHNTAASLGMVSIR